ncbi:MAG TPA: hypothetical protein VI072_32120 [Polyangiaceae bacterium]
MEVDVESEGTVRARDGGQDVLLEVDGRVGHAASAERGAEAALLAAQSDELGMAAALAREVETAALEDAAAEVLIELLDDELRQPSRLLGALAESWKVAGDGLVEDGLLGLTAAVTAELRRARVRRCVSVVREMAHEHPAIANAMHCSPPAPFRS